MAALIRIDAVWLSTEPMDMRCGPDRALARVVQVFGEARRHHAYLFANRRASRMKVLVHDGLGLWLCARKLHQGSFCWARPGSPTKLVLTGDQLQALVIGLPWHRLEEDGAIRVL